MSKRKQETIIVEEEVKGLPYDKSMKTILDFCVLGYCLISLLSFIFYTSLFSKIKIP